MHAPDYADALAAFRARTIGGSRDVAQVFHAVRAIPYGSGPDRTPLAALNAGRGACTAKHLILRDLLRDDGVAAVVELVDGDFAAGLTPAIPHMPPDLAAMTRARGVRDIHCRVRIDSAKAGVRRLDATWPDSMEQVGLAVDAGWDGTGDTRGAIPNVTLLSDAEDTLGEKARLLAAFSPDETARRRTFLRLLSDWLG